MSESGGEGSSANNTGIVLDRAFLSLTDITTLRSISASVGFDGRKISNFSPFDMQCRTVVEISCFASAPTLEAGYGKIFHQQ